MPEDSNLPILTQGPEVMSAVEGSMPGNVEDAGKKNLRKKKHEMTRKIHEKRENVKQPQMPQICVARNLGYCARPAVSRKQRIGLVRA